MLCSYSGPAVSNSTDHIKLENEEIILEASQICYDQDKGLAEAINQVLVTIKANSQQLEADQLTYDVKNGVIKATGSVKLTTEQAIYYAESITYNLHESIGATGVFEGRVAGKLKNYFISGDNLVIQEELVKISNAKMTRCPLPKPHYEFYAKKIIISDKKVRLTHVFLYFKGVPVFYFPIFIFNTDNLDKETATDFKLGFSTEDGLWLEYTNALPLNNNFNWGHDAKLSTKTGLGFGLGINVFGNISNHLNFNYDLNGIWTIKDITTLIYNSPLANFTVNAEHDFTNNENKLSASIIKDTPAFFLLIDGVRSFSADAEQQMGFSLTRKYRQGWLGNWQIGIEGRQVSKKGSLGENYGGIYGGYRIDYKPNNQLTLSYLRLATFSGGDYRDFGPNIGNSILFNVDVPVGKEYSFGISGSYKFDDSTWKSQSFRFTQDTCCYTFSISWDAVKNTWSVGPVFKF